MAKNDLDKGIILIAEPFMADPQFKKAVVGICDYSRDAGTVGYILNKPTELKMTELISDFPETDSPVFYGGPVANDTIHYIHRKGDVLDNSMHVGEGLYWGGDFDKLKFLIKTGVFASDDIRFFIGYSGWSPGQLEQEMKTGSWLIDRFDPNYGFSYKPAEMWNLTMKNKGSNFKVIADFSDQINPN